MSILATVIGFAAFAMIAAVWWWVDHIADDQLRTMERALDDASDQDRCP